VGGLVAYLIFVVPERERALIDNQMAISPMAEWIIDASRRCVKYWYGAVGILFLMLIGTGALFLANRRSLHWLNWIAWLLLAALPITGLVVVWVYLPQLPTPFRLTPNGQLHSDARLKSLMAAPEIEREWQRQFARFDVNDVHLAVFLFFLDPLWDEVQQIRPDVSQIYCGRLAVLDDAIIADWRAAFAKSIEVKPNAATIASLLIQHDRLFVDGVFNHREAQFLKTRMQNVPGTATDSWRELGARRLVPQLEAIGSANSRMQAIMDLIRRDELFLNERWQPDAFRSLCDRAAAQNRAD
jgi:hypothetical protein